MIIASADLLYYAMHFLIMPCIIPLLLYVLKITFKTYLPGHSDVIPKFTLNISSLESVLITTLATTGLTTLPSSMKTQAIQYLLQPLRVSYLSHDIAEHD